MCCFCTAENFVQVEVWAPNYAADESRWTNFTVYEMYGGFESLQRRQTISLEWYLRGLICLNRTTVKLCPID
jgi:hypothetical protein